MKVLSVGEFKSRFSEVLEWIRAGNTVAVSYGRSKKIVGYFSPNSKANNRITPELGLLSHAKATIADDWFMTEEELVDA